MPFAGPEFAAAYAAGAAALVRSRYPQLSATQAAARLVATAHAPGRGTDNKVGRGLIDPVAALTAKVPDIDADIDPQSVEKLLVPPPPPDPDTRPRRTAAIVAGAGAVVLVVIGGVARADAARSEAEVVMTETLTTGAPTGVPTDAPAAAAVPTHPAIARLRRPVGIRISLRRALIWAVLSASLVALVGGRWPLWAVIALIVVGALVAFVSVHGTVLSEKIGARYRYVRRRRRASGSIPGRVIDVDGVGVRQGDGFELVSAIELTADPAETRLREGRAFAAETVPLDLLATMMTQYGLDVDIDVASAGRRVPPAPPTARPTRRASASTPRWPSGPPG